MRELKAITAMKPEFEDDEIGHSSSVLEAQQFHVPNPCDHDPNYKGDPKTLKATHYRLLSNISV